MASGEVSFLVEVWERVVSSTILQVGLWGAAGGITNALIVKSNRREAVRLIFLGGFVSAGTSSVAGAIISVYFNLSTEAAVAIGGAGSFGYMAGIFFPAMFEVLLQRIGRGYLPNEAQEDKDNDKG